MAYRPETSLFRMLLYLNRRLPVFRRLRLTNSSTSNAPPISNKKTQNGCVAGEIRKIAAISPPTNDPAIPNRIVFPILIGSGPGMIHRANPPMRSPLSGIIRMRNKIPPGFAR